MTANDQWQAKLSEYERKYLAQRAEREKAEYDAAIQALKVHVETQLAIDRMNYERNLKVLRLERTREHAGREVEAILA